LELGMKGVQNPDKPFEVPHQIIGEHLCAILAYDLPTSMATINDEQLEKWGVTFYEAMEVARQNLEETTKQVAQAGSLYIVTHGDSYDSSRLLLTDRMRKLDFQGDIITLVPNRDSLFLAGSDDPEALAIMAELAKEPLEGPRSISGIAFRLVDDEWEPWLPPVGHPSREIFNLMQVKTIDLDYRQQQELLEKQQSGLGGDLFFAAFNGIQDKKTGAVSSYCVWTEGILSSLPRTETIALVKAGPNGKAQIVARGAWEDVQREVGHLMTPQDLYPPRWLVESFPTDDELARIGISA
jgi:hypothetical protein